MQQKVADAVLKVVQTEEGLLALYPVYDEGGGAGPSLLDTTRISATVTQGPSSYLLRNILGSHDFVLGGDAAFSLSANASTAEASLKNK